MDGSDNASLAAGDAAAPTSSEKPNTERRDITLRPAGPSGTNDRRGAESDWFSSSQRNDYRELETPNLRLLPLPSPETIELKAGVKDPRFPNMSIKMGLAATAILALTLGGGLFYDLVGRADEVAARERENKVLVATVSALKERLTTLESSKAKDEASEIRKILGELKQGTQATRDIGAALTQLTNRVEHLERDQSTRLEKIGEKLDRDSAAKMTEIANRLEKPEKRTSPVLAAAPAAAKPTVTVSNETTGSIDRPLQRLRGFSLEEVHDGFAVIVSRDGPQSVAPGDFIPGAGKVLRIERRSREWVVVTNLGLIGPSPGYY